MKPRAAQISVNPSGLAVVTTTNVQAALAEIDDAFADHETRIASLEALGGGGGGGTTLHVSRSANTASGFPNTLTLAQTPFEESLEIWINGLLKTPGVDYTLSGAVVTFPVGLSAGAVVIDTYQTTTAAPGESTLSGSSPPAVRGATLGRGAGAATVALPSGTVAGDIAIINAFTHGSENIPALSGITGWTTLQTVTGWGGQITAWKVLTAGDITAGSVTATTSGGDTSAIIVTGAGTSAVFIGEHRGSGGSVTSSGAATGTPNVDDRVIWMSFGRVNEVPTHSRSGTSLGTVLNSNISSKAVKETATATASMSNTATTTATAGALDMTGVSIR